MRIAPVAPAVRSMSCSSWAAVHGTWQDSRRRSRQRPQAGAAGARCCSRGRLEVAGGRAGAGQGRAAERRDAAYEVSAQQ